jgi:hypothetical protein
MQRPLLQFVASAAAIVPIELLRSRHDPNFSTPSGPPDQAINVEDAGIEFIESDGGLAGVRLKNPAKKRT